MKNKVYCKDCKFDRGVHYDFCYIINEFTGMAQELAILKSEKNQEGECDLHTPEEAKK